MQQEQEAVADPDFLRRTFGLFLNEETYIHMTRYRQTNEIVGVSNGQNVRLFPGHLENMKNNKLLFQCFMEFVLGKLV